MDDLSFSDAVKDNFIALDSAGKDNDRVSDTRQILNTVLDVPVDISLSWNSPEDSLLAPNNNPLYDIVSDFHLYNYAFCKEQRFSEAQTSTFLAIMKRVLDKDLNVSDTDIEQSHQRFTHLLMKECVERPPHSKGIFSLEQGEQILKYVVDSYYRHWNLYHFNFTRRMVTVL